MSTIRNAVDSVRRTASTATTHVVEAATVLLVGLGLAGWSLFWSRVGRMHYAQGDLVSAAFTTTVFVLPAIGAFVWYVATSLDVDTGPTEIDVNVIGG
ncbi:hypothetical protein [Halorubrum cibi]|uniref:Uncharacterized protein n=1 Tax=Halorubrum cibi TaxID=413815 RepID=A0A521B5I2_9EURY|nr:hypothetical protein [Halorubrum cibi]SMO42354.1 hypothetical protein SAMN06264867_10230 [Halorubrum cibi]